MVMRNISVFLGFCINAWLHSYSDHIFHNAASESSHLKIFTRDRNLNDSITLQDYIDAHYIRRSISLASLAQGKTHPNPCVGCVIVDTNGHVVGEGFHVKAGEPHAEAVALQQAGSKAIGGTAYVSLEPCNHFGRTPPCSHAIVRHGIKRIVAGMVDPDPRVSGQGLSFMRANGLDVKLIDGSEMIISKEINAPFVYRVLHHKPHITVWCGYESLVSATQWNNCFSNAVNKDAVKEMMQSALVDIDTILLTSDQILTSDQDTAVSLDLLLSCLPSNRNLSVIIVDISMRSHRDSDGDNPNNNPDTINQLIKGIFTNDLYNHHKWYIVTNNYNSSVPINNSNGINIRVLTPMGDIGVGIQSSEILLSYEELGLQAIQQYNNNSTAALLGSNAVLILCKDIQRLHYLNQKDHIQRLLLSFHHEVPNIAEIDRIYGIWQSANKSDDNQLENNRWEEWINKEELMQVHKNFTIAETLINWKKQLIATTLSSTLSQEMKNHSEQLLDSTSSNAAGIDSISAHNKYIHQSSSVWKSLFNRFVRSSKFSNNNDRVKVWNESLLESNMIIPSLVFSTQDFSTGIIHSVEISTPSITTTNPITMLADNIDQVDDDFKKQQAKQQTKVLFSMYRTNLWTQQS